jgi:hypothetical protein
VGTALGALMGSSSDQRTMTCAVQCHGLLVSQEYAGTEYRVEYQLQLRGGSLGQDEARRTLRGECTTFFVRSADSRPIRDGHYSLRSTDGQTHRVQQLDRSWYYLGTCSAAARR